MSKTKYICVPTRHGLFNVVDAATGSPVEVDATAIFLTRREAHRLIARLDRAASHGNDDQRLVVPQQSLGATREYEGGRQWYMQELLKKLPRHPQNRTWKIS
ncbi:hypothetical protein [Rhizobium sp. S96]|uniref:hypothetical protein n=1 Tax=Rhizobium sp. S96 TaxID=3055140 RepID=UPI0025AAF9BC|nr:hypothetical protein [Rhizobium sp. S96]MDM9622079.1 hypothetical protein [Rhizobium sp. S96]